MTIELDNCFLEKISFPDYYVTNMELNLENRLLKIDVDGMWIDFKDGINLGPGCIYFSNWESITMKRWLLESKWDSLQKNEFEYLKEICEIKHLNTSTFLCGFGTTTGLWVEWEIQNPKFKAEFSVENEQHRELEVFISECNSKT